MEETVKCNLEKLGKSILTIHSMAGQEGQEGQRKEGALAEGAKKGGASWKWFSVLVAENGFSFTKQR